MANKHINKHINKLLDTRKKLHEVDLSARDKYVFFSDLHRGLMDTADDFKEKNQLNYFSALRHYFDEGYSLALLGDIEELEEQQNIKKVMDKQTEAIREEQRFHQEDRLIRVFGNHDDKWEKDKHVNKFLHPHFPSITVYEGILFHRENNTKILAIHGHQGALGSDILPFVEFLLPLYRFGLNLIGKNRHNEFKDVCLVGDRENHLYDWVKTQDNTLLFCGHTHRPVWGALTHAEKLLKRVDQLKVEIRAAGETQNLSLTDTLARADDLGISHLKTELEDTISTHNARVKISGMCNVKTKAKPLYFNTGSCMFTDGDITGLELEGETLRLIKWTIDNGTSVRQILEEDQLDTFFDSAN